MPSIGRHRGDEVPPRIQRVTVSLATDISPGLNSVSVDLGIIKLMRKDAYLDYIQETLAALRVSPLHHPVLC